MRGLIRLLTFFLVMFLMAACGGTPPTLPTEIPSVTPVPPTATVTPTRTPLPTLTPTIPAPQTTSADPSQQAYIRFVNAAPQLDTVDFYVDGLAYASFMEFTNYTDQGGLVAGEYTINAVPNGSKDFTTAFASAPLTLVGGDSVIIVLTGNAETAALTLVKEDLSPVNGNVARVTLFNALSDAPVSISNGTTTINNDTGYGAVSLATVTEAGELDFNIRSAGEIIYADKFDLRERQNTTFIVTPRVAGSDGADLIVLNTPILGIGKVSIINLVEDITVDVVAGGEIIGRGLGYAYIVEPQELRATDYELQIFAEGVDRTAIDPVYLGNLSILPDRTLYLIMLGKPEEVRVLTHVLDTEPTETGTVRMTFVNALSEFPRVQVESNVALTAVVAYGQLLEDEILPAGSLPLSWYEYGAATGDALELQPEFAVLEGTDILYFMTGQTQQEPLLIVNNVGIQAPAPDPNQATAIPETAPSIYALNSLDGLSLQFFVDDVPLGVPVNPRSSNSGVTLTAGEHVFTVTRPDTGELLARLISTGEINKQYVAVATGRIETGYQILLVNADAPINPDNLPTVRLINTSEPSTIFGLGIVVNNGNTSAFPDLNGEIDPNTGTVSFRVNYPVGVTNLLENITSGNGSTITPVSLGAGVLDLYLVDNQSTTVAAIVPAVGFEMGKHYDIVAFQAPLNEQVTVVIVPYIAP